MKLSIKTKIISFIIIPFALFLGGYLSFISLSIESIVLEYYSIGNSNLVASYAETINQVLSKGMNLVELEAENIADRKDEISEYEIKEFLQDLIKDEKLIYGSVLAYAPGKYKNRNLFAPYVFKIGDSIKYIDIAEELDYTEPDREWYSIPSKTLKPFWTKPYNAPILDDKPLITYSFPIIKNGELFAVLEIDINLEEFDEYLGTKMPTQKGRFLIVDENGTYIANPNSQKIASNNLLDDSTSIISYEQRKNLFSQIKDNSAGYLEFENVKTNEKILSFYAPIKKSGWTLVIYTVKEELLSVITNLFTNSFIIIALIFLAAGLVVLGFTNKLLKPITSIREFTSKIISGNYESKIEIKSQDEFGELSSDLNEMSQTLKSRREELIKINEELEQRVNQRTLELSDARKELELALSSAEMGTWKYFIQENRFEADENTKKLYGVVGEFSGKAEELRKYIHPDDRVHRLEVIQETLNNKKENYISDFRILKPSNEISHIRSSGKFFYDENGNPKYGYGVVWDISKIKNAEERLKSALDEAKRLSIAVEQSPVLITITDPEANIVYVNPEYTNVTGYSSDEVIGKKHTLIRTNVVTEELYEKYKRMIELGRTLQGEFESVKKDGSKFWMKIKGTGITDENNKIKNIVFIEDDITAQKNAELELKEKNEFIALRNKYITDSIVYAKRIQDAILPEKDFLKSLLKNHYLIFKPKDVVSGDFYWMNRIGTKLVIAQVDCTGHGVPGALMSMIGNTLLNEIIILQNTTDSADIINKLNSRLIEELNRNENSDAKDGMDAAICVIDIERHRLQFSGAYRPLLYIRENSLFELKGDRKSIGDNKRSNLIYTSSEVEIDEETRIYLFSDGIVDQNNYENKKLGTKKLKEIILDSVQDKLEVQGEKISEYLLQHQGEEEQRDDITFFAFNLMDVFDKNIDMQTEFEFSDVFSYEYILKIGEAVEQKYSGSLPRNAYKQLYFSVMELAHNIGLYSNLKYEANGKSDGIGNLIIQKDDKSILISTSNEISSQSKILINEKLKYYNSLDRDKLKLLLKEKLRSEREDESKGGGIGLIEIIKRTNNPIEYEFTEIDENKSNLILTAIITIGESDG